MKRLIALSTVALALSACGNGVGLPSKDTSLKDQLRNPLYAEFYYQDFVETLVSLSLQDDPILEKPGVRASVDRARVRALEHANLAEEAQDEGRRGSFISDRLWVEGEALLLDGVLYLGPTFNSAPGPELSMYLTTTIDPRDGDFPDETAVKLGTVKNQYGAHAYVVPVDTPRSGTGALRTAVLWDDELGMLYGFAQLSLVTP